MRRAWRAWTTCGAVMVAWGVGGACLGCGGAAAETALPTQQQAGGEVAPYPYTVSQIRAGCHDRVVQYRIEKAGAPPVDETWTFRDIDPETVNVTTTRFDASGAAVGAPENESAKWADLHEHARFPRAATTIDDDTLDLPTGKVECMRYVVTRGDEVKTYWFARTLAGPPVKLAVTKAGAPVMTMTMQANRTR